MSTHRSSHPWTRLLAALAMGALLGGCSLFVGPSPSPSPTATPTLAPTPTASATPIPSATPAPTPTPTPTTGPCDAADLAARITFWDAGAGHRFASVGLTNIEAAPCRILALSRPQLVDGSGTILIDGAPPGLLAVLTLASGDILKTTVDAANYCGPGPVPPVTVAFVLAASGGRIIAAPLSPTDTTGIPPCLGSTVPAEIEMQRWAP